jgi:phosphoglycerate dehydrogenase-like enzyme
VTIAERPAGRVRVVLSGPVDERWPQTLMARFQDVDVVHFPRLADAVAAGAGRGAHVLLTGGGTSADAFLDQADDLRWIQTSSAGVDGILTPALRARTQVAVTAMHGIHGDQMAEHTLALLLALTRSLPAFLRQQARREWKRHVLPEMRGRLLAVVGYGSVGRSIARLGRAVGLRVVGVRRGGDGRGGGEDDGGTRVVGMAELDAVLAEADYVVLTLPLTPQTRGLFDGARLARMRDGAFLVNVGRGPVLDETALVGALTAGPLAGAALDVFAEEPLPAQSPLWDLPNVIVTPHVAAASPRYFEQVMQVFSDNLGRFLAGEPLRHGVDRDRGY